MFTGCAEGTEASHLDGCVRQRYLWNLLGHRRYPTRLGRIVLLEAQSSCISHCSHNDHVQFRCQSVCICSDKPTIQGEDEEDDMLQFKIICPTGSCCEGTTGHRVRERHRPVDQTSRTMSQGVMR